MNSEGIIFVRVDDRMVHGIVANFRLLQLLDELLVLQRVLRLGQQLE